MMLSKIGISKFFKDLNFISASFKSSSPTPIANIFAFLIALMPASASSNAITSSGLYPK